MVMEDELEVLRNIYDIDFSISNTFPPRYGIVVSAIPDMKDKDTGNWEVPSAGNSDASQLQVLFEPPDGYPSVAIIVRIASLYAPPKVSEQLKSLESLLNERARELAEFEEMAMYEVAETARAWLWEQTKDIGGGQDDRIWIGELLNEAFDWDTRSISPSGIVTHQMKTERKVMLRVREEYSVDVTVSQARKWLRSSLWDVRKAVDGIKKELSTNRQQAHSCCYDEAKTYTCGVCFDDLEEDGRIVFAPCNHVVCIGCFIQFITIKINEKQVWNIRCPGDAKCCVFVDPITIGWLLSKDLSEKYSLWFRQSFVELQQRPNSTRRYFWCSNHKCQNALSIKSHSAKSSMPGPKIPVVLHCVGCNMTECHECNQVGGHWPATCEDVKMYQTVSQRVNIAPPKKIDDELQTKRCPKCRIMITKNGGCPHMHCTSCGFDFCWQCGTYWFDPQHSSVYPFKCTGEDKDGRMAAIEMTNFLFDDTADNWPAQLKRLVISHEAEAKREFSAWALAKNSAFTTNLTNNLLRSNIGALLTQIHYILKHVCMFLFTRHQRRTPAVNRVFEITHRFDAQLTSLEILREMASRLGRGDRRGSLRASATDMTMEHRFQEVKRERSQVIANIKLLTVAMGAVECRS
ncbi:hypothetical protein BC936DRAFT_137571 [Jimgerdemannia flammicorona]|uniref:RWD domain-containing protein n=1 Tax=Jimgerdemannia flammicorona TaxID=994334 RepID=A0A433CX10_9FUNG|nr:hypothetical protein BC936DRAFT_137571 [Jimgerdemannia flammicorona]